MESGERKRWRARAMEEKHREGGHEGGRETERKKSGKFF